MLVSFRGAVRIETTSSGILALIIGADRAQRSFGARLIGLAIVTLGPAFFWVGVLAFVSHMFGAPLSSGTLVLTGAAIGVFLCIICAPLIFRSDGSRDS
jgi:hypothetical protein